jgi:hypothetical protein
MYYKQKLGKTRHQIVRMLIFVSIVLKEVTIC